MITCYKCGQIIRDIRELTEVRSLGLALMGRCPGCGTRINCQALWKKTQFIDKTRHTITPDDAKNSLETVLERQIEGAAEICRLQAQFLAEHK